MSSIWIKSVFLCSAIYIFAMIYLFSFLYIVFSFICFVCFFFFFFKQKTSYEMRIRDWSSDVCSSDLDLLHLGLIVVIIDVGTHLDLFDVLRLLRLAGLVGLFLRLVFEFADIEELGDGRIGVGRDLDEVETDLGCLLDRLARVHHAQIFALVIDHADLLALDELVVTWAVHRRLGARGARWGGVGERTPLL